MSYNGSGTFVVNSAGQPVVTGTVISSTAFNALTADLATGLSTAITKDGQTTTTSRILFAQGISSTLVTDATSSTTGSIISAGGISCQKAAVVGTLLGVGVAPSTWSLGAAMEVGNAGFGLWSAASNTIRMMSNLTYNGGYLYKNAAVAAFLGVDVGALSFQSTAAGSAGAPATLTERFTVTNAGLVGIGMTPSNVLDITQTQDGASIIGFKNASTGTSGRVDLRLFNSSNLGLVTLFGTGFTSANVLRSGGVLLQGDGSGGVTLNTGAAQPIYFGINSVEVARIDTSGQLMVGTTSNNGSISNTAPVIGGNIITNRGTVSVGNAATVTMFSTVSGLANYLVSAAINVGDATNYACAALVLTDGSSTQVVQLRNGANGTSITASGQAIRFTNGGIGTQTVYWSVTRMGHN